VWAHGTPALRSPSSVYAVTSSQLPPFAGGAGLTTSPIDMSLYNSSRTLVSLRQSPSLPASMLRATNLNPIQRFSGNSPAKLASAAVQ